MPNNTSRHTSVAFSGYRTSKIMRSSPNSQILNTIAADLSEVIVSLYARGFRNFISGGATGFDTMAAVAVLRAKRMHPDITLTLAIPFENHYSKFTSEQHTEYQSIASSTDYVVYVSKEFHSRAYLDRNDFMLRSASVLVCYYDGQQGGTMYTVNRAVRSGVEIINVCRSYEIAAQDFQLSLFS